MTEIRQERHKKLTEKIRNQVALEEKAFRVVEKLVDLTPSEDSLRADLQLITFDQYSDIVDERSIAKLCGYPLCGSSLTDVPSKKYHICVKTKTVYDISQRKKFCSNRCCKASEYLQKQIPTAPIWLRENEPIKFIPPSINKGSVGEVVVARQKTQLEEDLDVLAKLDELTLRSEPITHPPTAKSGVDCRQLHAPDCSCRDASTLDVHFYDDEDDNDDDNGRDSDHENLNFPQATENKRKNASPMRLQTCSPKAVIHATDPAVITGRDLSSILARKLKGTFHKCVDDIADCGDIKSVVGIKQAERRTIKTIPLSVVIELEKSLVDSKLESTQTNAASLPRLFSRIKSVLLDWKTESTVALIKPDAVNSLQQMPREVDFDERRFESRLLAYDKLLDGDVPGEINIPTKKVPDLEKLEQAGRQFEVKVNEFYGQKTVKFADSPELQAELEAKEVVLPLVHSHSQNAIRRKVVLDKLEHVLRQILDHTRLRMNDVSTSVRDLVHSFRLTSTNILLKSGEWKLVGYILLKIIAERDATVRDAMSCDTIRKFVEQLLAANSLIESHINELVGEILTLSASDKENLLQQQEDAAAAVLPVADDTVDDTVD